MKSCCLFMIWPQFCSRARWRSSFDSWARAFAKLDVTNEFSSFALARRITRIYIKKMALIGWIPRTFFVLYKMLSVLQWNQLECPPYYFLANNLHVCVMVCLNFHKIWTYWTGHSCYLMCATVNLLTCDQWAYAFVFTSEVLLTDPWQMSADLHCPISDVSLGNEFLWCEHRNEKLFGHLGTYPEAWFTKENPC